MSIADRTREELRAGVDHFNARRWWHAHESWEQAWKKLEGDEHEWIQGLIQAASVFHLLEIGRTDPALRLARSALTKLRVESWVRVPGLRHTLERLLEAPDVRAQVPPLIARFFDYEATAARIEALGRMPAGAPSLANMREALKHLGIAIPADRVIVVAGTNGKGSVSATLEALLRATGASTGLFTSPHLIRATERFRVDGEDASAGLFCEAADEVARATHGLEITHFECLTLMAAWIFFGRKRRVDWAVLEVGMGGLFDATNAVPHAHCIITPIAKDHEAQLGNTLLEIARNKFGIVTLGASVAHAKLEPELLPLQNEIERATQSRWTESPSSHAEFERGVTEPKHFAKTPWGRFEINLPGRRGAENTTLALTAFEQLGFNVAKHAPAGLQRVRWPGRMQRLNTPIHPRVYVSGDHNPQGIASLIELLPAYREAEHVHFIVGIANDKDTDGIIAPLAGVPRSSLWLTETTYRTKKIKDYGAFLERARASDADPIALLRQVASQASPSDLIVVTGSLYLVGRLLALAH